MQEVLILMLAMAAPTPYHVKKKEVTYEQSPIWGKNPVPIAKFGNNLDIQLANQKNGADRHKAFVEQLAKFRVPIVGQIQMQTSVSRSFSSNVR